MNWDEQLFFFINGLVGRHPWLDLLMVELGRPSNLRIPAAVGLVFWVWRKRREAVIAAVVVGLVVVLGDALGAQLKYLVGRARPCQILTGIHELVGCGKTLSFPSNHVLNMAAVVGFLGVLYPKTGWVGWPFVMLLAISRVFVGAHYLTDGLGGAAIGGLLGAGVAVLLLRAPWFRRLSTLT